ncbi:heptaprenyl diphosphate synthase component 1 [Bacillus sp. BP-3]|uniref:heptaprenyl diphosphate synthase component 1 n=1 Tax=Bacillus sp. BP-3 TaxID=3022773 RepID=UPI00232B9A47|nr:heptaprenyl diphosphate synthase component 1 [Bacillus sp. BP-3]MDC2865935.1 heptaprenyl diphosphate synthase component 1 [Bacillus sp. BP-3]
MGEIYGGFADIKEQLYKKLRHPYFIKYIEEPVVDEKKIAFLYSILKSANLHKEQIEHYAVTIMLVQIALDTHEKVSNKEETDEFHKRRQLTVLAGDYYSGLYYYLLSMNHDITLIRALADGIKEINEQKIMLYQQTYETIEEMLKSIGMIESALLQKTCDHFQVQHVKSAITNMLAIDRLQTEYQIYMKKESSPVFAAFQKILSYDGEMKVENVYNELIRKMRSQVNTLMQNNTGIETFLSTLKEAT